MNHNSNSKSSPRAGEGNGSHYEIFYFEQLGIDLELLSSIENELHTTWMEVFGGSSHEITIDEVGEFAESLLEKYPNEIGVIEFVLSLGLVLLPKRKICRFNFVPTLDYAFTETVPRSSFPIFRLLTLMIQNRSKLPSFIANRALDIFAYHLLNKFIDTAENFDKILDYYKYSFSASITPENSFSLIKLFFSLEYSQFSQKLLSLFEKLLKHFNKNEKTKKWIIFLMLSSLLSEYAYPRSVVAKRGIIVTPLHTVILQLHIHFLDASLLELLRTITNSINLEFSITTKLLMDKLSYLIDEKPWNKKYFDYVDFVDLFFRKFYYYLFDETPPINEQFFEYIFLVLSSTFVPYYPFVLIEEIMKNIDLPPQKLRRLFMFLYTLSTDVLQDREARVAIKALVRGAMAVCNKLGTDYLIKILTELKTNSNADLRYVGFRYLYEITGDEALLKEAKDDPSARVSSWADKEINKKLR